MTQETIIDDQKLVIKRTFAATIERVYQAWTDPAQMARWYAPNERWKSCEVVADPTPGGRYDLTWRHLDGDTLRVGGQYLEIVPNVRLSFTWAMVGGEQPGEDMRVTVDLRAVPEGTELTLTHDRQPNLQSVEGTSVGWTGCLDMLESFLNGKPMIGN
jgi:uncharacterized protein YndB with AHSA1/START domain